MIPIAGSADAFGKRGGAIVIEKETYRMVESWLGKYPLWQIRMENLKAQLHELPRVTQKFEEVPSFGGGFISDSTYKVVERRLQVSEVELANLKLRVRLLESALSALSNEEREIVELKYFRGLSNQAIWEVLALSRMGFYRRKTLIIQKVYEVLGGDKSPIWFDVGPREKVNDL